jgi:hypothetical protein
MGYRTQCWQYREQRRPEPSTALDLSSNIGRHSFHVEIDQRQCRFFPSEDYVCPGARDDTRLPIELLFGDDLHLLGQSGTQGAKCNRLVWANALDDIRQLSDVGDVHPLGRAARHHAGAAITFDRAVWRE